VNKCPTLRASGICGLRKSARAHYVNIVCIPALILFAMSHTWAMNGIGVYTNYHCPWTEATTYSGERYFPRGQIVKTNITDNKVVRRDTLFRDVGQYPTFSPDGKHIAFFRWGVRISLVAGKWTEVVGTANTQCYLSVMDADGNNLINLLPVGNPSVTSTPIGGTAQWDKEEGCAVLDWPRVDGVDWIYYEKPPKTAEIWRVKATDASTNQFVCRYNSGTFLRRWDMSLDGKWSDAQSRGDYGFNAAYAFPLVDNDLGKTRKVAVQGCNSTVSCGANLVIHNYGSNHSLVCVEQWDHVKNVFTAYTDRNLWAYATSTVEDILPSLGQEKLFVPGKGDADLNRFSVNSEKWVCREIEWCGQGMGRSQGSNSVAVNWKEKQAVKKSNTPQPPSCPGYGDMLPAGYGLCADAGDLWIDFGAGNQDKWEDENGVLHPMTSAVSARGPVHGASGAPGVGALRIMRTGVVISYSGMYELTVIDACGNVVATRHGRGPDLVDLHRLHAGLYLVRASLGARNCVEKFTPALL